ncbi:hypothetical protein CMUS01_14639 [Colletotrichum musicola]|uniref:Secreted protein n=1 Tax=Colletotrichum musicola TaxID=2175873 RepID=A0A8H6MRB9_9PEZI|nr:hypothetical protein CMUS01_14639 [Colletotrichum musicola]
MKPLSTIVTALAGGAAAMICTSSETYCGSRLLSLDANNSIAIAGALTAGRQPADDARARQSVFWCVPPGVPVPGDSGLLFVTHCGPENVCLEGGALGGVGDACAEAPGGSF